LSKQQLATQPIEKRSQMNPNQEILQDQTDSNENSSSLKTLAFAVITGFVFWGSLFALLFISLVS